MRFAKVERSMKLTIILKDIRSVLLVLAQRILTEISCLHKFLSIFFRVIVATACSILFISLFLF